MAQVGRISGPLLKENLLRNGNNLAFRNDVGTTQLLYLDVTDGRIAVNHNAPNYDLDIVGTLQTTNLISPNAITAGLTFANSTISAIGNIELNAAEAVVLHTLENGTIRINDNTISTIVLNTDVDLTPQGTGTTEIINDLNVFGNIHTLGDITFEGTITLGDNDTDSVTFNSDITSDIIPDQTQVYNLGSTDKQWSHLYTNLLNGTAASTGDLLVNNVDILFSPGNTLYVAVNGDDSNRGDHILDPFATIARALSAAEASGEQPVTIIISPGEYQETLPLVVPSNVTVSGKDIRNCIIIPDTSSQSNDVFHLSDSTTVINLTIKNHFYDSINNTGYAFRFSPNATMTTRSPYIQNVSVITQESSIGAGDAGRGAWIDGDELNAATVNRAMLFHSCTFISPGADVINMTNDVRVEWLNSFTYYANRGLYAFAGSNGGAELRSIGSANVYGTYGAVADGADTLMYLIQHNFAYIGAGNKNDNNLADVIQANEVVELNSGQIHFVTTDQLGNFRIGDNFFIDFDTGDTSINIDTGSIDALDGLIIKTGPDETIITSTKIETGNIRFTQNQLTAIGGDLNLLGATDTLNLQNNSTVTGNVTIRDNFSFGGTLNLAGNQDGRTTDSDKLTFNVEFEQDFVPNTTFKFDLGESQRHWQNAFLDQVTTVDLIIDDNYIETTNSNANLELRANGTGDIFVPSNDVEVDNNLTVSSITDLQDTNITTVLLHTGNRIQSGNYNIAGELTVDNIYVEDNFITTDVSNANLELRSTQRIYVPNNNVQLDNNLTVSGITDLQSTNITGTLTHTGTKTQTGDVDVVGNLTVIQDIDFGARAQFEEILFDGNVITTITSDADLELRANGTGKILVPTDNVNIVNNLSVDNVFNNNNINVTLQTEFNEADVSDITITQNYITTNNGNADLELRANGTGIVELDKNAVFNNVLSVNKTTTFKDSFFSYEYGPELVANGTFDSNLLNWDQAGGGTATATGGNLRINATGAARNVSQEVTVEAGKTYDFEAQFRSVSNANAFYLRIFESGVGTLFEWNEASGLIPDQLLTFSFVPAGTAIDVIFRAVDTIVEWDNISMFEDIGFVENFTPVQSNIIGNTTQTGNTTQIGNIDQIGNSEVFGNLTVSNEITTPNFNINDNVIQNYREDLRIDPSNPYDPLSLPQIVKAMQQSGATADDYTEQTEKNLITFLANGTSVPYAYSYIDVNNSGSITSSDALAWLQYVANGSTPNAAETQFIANVVELLLEDEFANPGKYNSNLFLGDYYRADVVLNANGSGRIVIPTNDVRVANDLFAASINAADIIINQNVALNELVINDSIIEIDDNFISTTTSNADLELRSTRNLILPGNSFSLNQDLDIGKNSSIKDLNVVGNITHTGNRTQLGNLSVVGTVTVSTSNIKSEIQFDDIVFDDNYIETTNSNANLEFRANGAGILTIPSNDVRFRNDATLGTLNSSTVNIANALEAEVLEISSDIRIFDNVITTTETNSNLELRSFNADINIESFFVNNNDIRTGTSDISLNANNNLIINSTKAVKLPLGSTSNRNTSFNNIRFNTDNNVFEAFNNSNTITFNGIYSSNRRTSLLADPTNNTIPLTIQNVNIGIVNADGMSIHGLAVDDITLQNNIIKTAVSNSDLELKAHGTGTLNIDDIRITNNTIQITNSENLILRNTTYGKIKFNDTSAVRIPAGSTAEQLGSAPEVGMMRWNTDIEVLETWDGNTYISAAGNAATISQEEMDNLILEYTLIFG